jgi:S1-C subfamily serine protease
MLYFIIALLAFCCSRLTEGFAPGITIHPGRGRATAANSSSSPRHHNSLSCSTRQEVNKRGRATLLAAKSSSSFAVPSAELEKNLSAEEKTVVAVVRGCGPSVAYVVSILPVLANDDATRRRRRASSSASATQNGQSTNGLPRGQSLGSGSGFVVDSRGYIVTNFHVVEQAYRLQQASRQLDEFVTQLTSNMTISSPFLGDLLNATIQSSIDKASNMMAVPEVYVRLDSTTSFQQCRFVDVRPDLDVAVLKLIDATTTIASGGTNTDNASPTPNPPPPQLQLSPLSFGSSSDLLVGQSLVAIGNPFGFTSTVTTGVVSALNRQLSLGPTGQRPPISNCIQTDCAINPGNSGGPLLNLQGQVVGVNTAIVSTTGSNAGIGFAISSDQVAPVVRSIIRNDTTRRAAAWLGIYILKEESSVRKMGQKKDRPLLIVGKVAAGSPAARADIRGIDLSRNAVTRYGDAIVAVGGNTVTFYDELQRELMRCVVGEQLALTVEDVSTKERRVVYLTLEAKAAT